MSDGWIASIHQLVDRCIPIHPPSPPPPPTTAAGRPSPGAAAAALPALPLTDVSGVRELVLASIPTILQAYNRAGVQHVGAFLVWYVWIHAWCTRRA